MGLFLMRPLGDAHVRYKKNPANLSILIYEQSLKLFVCLFAAFSNIYDPKSEMSGFHCKPLLLNFIRSVSKPVHNIDKSA